MLRKVKKYIIGLLLGCLGASGMILPVDEAVTAAQTTDYMHRRDISVWTYDVNGTRLLISSEILQIANAPSLGCIVLHAELYDALRDTFLLYVSGIYHDDRGVKDFGKKGDRGKVTLTTPHVRDIPIAIQTWITSD
jgi:hypothetical protein